MEKKEEKEAVLLFGVNPVREKLRSSPEEVFQVLMVKGRHRPALRSIDEAARRCGLPVHYVESRVLDRLTKSRSHQGVAAKVGPHLHHSLDDLLRELSLSARQDWILCLDGVTDPRNFGAILRSAEAVGIHRIVIPKDRSVGVTPTVVRTSAGAVHYQKIYRVSNLRRALQELKGKGYWIVGLDVGAEEGIYGRVYPEKLVVVLGAEGTGIRPLIREECDFLVLIPMEGRVSSLNVAVAGGVFFYELLRQKGLGKNSRQAC